MSLLRFAAIALFATAAGAQTTEDWREDLRFLATQLPARHKNAYARMTPAQWDAAVKALDTKLPTLKRHEVIVEFMRLVAMVRDGHTALAPEFDQERIGFHRFPIQLYDFSDGLFIISADSAHRDIVGAKVTLIGPSSSEAALQTVSKVISHESPNWARARAASLLAIPEVLAALGMGKDSLTAEFTLEVEGKKRVVTLKGTGAAGGNAHLAFAQTVNMRRATAGDDPLYLRHADDAWWYTMTDERLLYIGYRAVAFFANGQLNEQFFRSAFASGDTARMERVILDMRDNGGGNNFLNRAVVKEIVRRPNIDRANGCLVLIGRGVFSAAQNLVNELDYYTNCTFVGEPTGNAPNQYGDARPLELPKSKLVVRVSSLLWQSHIASDERAWFQPDYYAENSSIDYKSKNDAVISMALRKATGASLAKNLEAPAAMGDSAEVRRIIDGHRFASSNKYRNPESDVNAAGYELLRTGKVSEAVVVFRANVALFPRSGNAWDSLGEALEQAGKKDEAVEAAKKAIDLEPQLVSSRDRVRRLTASP